MSNEADELVAYEDDEVIAPSKNDTKEVKKGSYVGIHATSFKDMLLKTEIMKAISDCGFENPSEVQQQCIPQAILGSDVLCQAKAGMGKTAVFVIAILQQLDIDESKKAEVLVLVLAHTRELAFQIMKEFQRLSKYMPHVKTDYFCGGQPKENNVAALEKNTPHIVVGTPGRILQLVQEKKLNLGHLKHFVVDECDNVLEKLDMRKDVQDIFRTTPHSKQVMMFTATLSSTMRPVCKKFMHNPLEILVDDERKLTLHGLQQHYVSLSENEKNRRLCDLLDALEFNQVVVFVKSVPRARELNKLLTECNFPSICIHSGLKQEERLACYKLFKDFQKRIMVATDIFGRGIDIERVNIVINYDMPITSDTYLHRVGRAGRFGTKGLAITFATPEDSKMLEEVQSRFEVSITELPDEIDVSSYMS